MKPKLFFMIFCLIFSTGLILACDNVGEIVDGQYCGVDGEYHDQLEEGEECLNDYECLGGSCTEGSCQSKYSGLEERGNIFEEILGTLGTTEDDSGGNGGNGGGSSSSISIVIYSPKNVTYGYFSIPLEVVDIRGKAGFWRYSLNNGGKTDFVPNITIVAQQGQNVLKIFARETNRSSETSKSVSFNVVQNPSGYCGDYICDAGESCSNCESDCGSCVILTYCGDNYCDYDEDEDLCPQDCITQKSKRGLVIFLIILSVVILLVLFIIIKFINKERKRLIQSSQISPIVF